MGFINPFFCDVKVGYSSQTLLKGFLSGLFASPTLRTLQQIYTPKVSQLAAKRWLEDDPFSFKMVINKKSGGRTVKLHRGVTDSKDLGGVDDLF